MYYTLKKEDKVLLQAHRGIELEYPDNTIPSYRAAADAGYAIIEADYRMTKDGVPVMIHNRTINSTGRRADGSRIEEKKAVADMTYKELLEYDFGVWKGERFRGTKIPTLEETLELARSRNIAVKIDNKHWSCSSEERETAYGVMSRSGANLTVSCFTLEDAREVKAFLPGASVSFDGTGDAELLSQAAEIAGHGRVQTWIPIEKARADWAPDEWFISAEQCREARKYARVCLWAIGPERIERALSEYEPWAVETSGQIRPYRE